MKRILTIALACLLLCTALVSCGSREKTDISGAATIADLTGATLAAQADTFHLTALGQISGITVLDYPDFTDLLNALNSGAIDGYVAEEPTALSVCAADSTLKYRPFVNNSTGFTASAEDVQIAIGIQKNSPVTAQVNAALSLISQEEREQMMQLAIELSVAD